MSMLDQVFLLLTGALTLYLEVVLYRAYKREGQAAAIYYLVSVGVLLVAGLLLLGFGFGVLESPLVAIVATLIPLGLATGLVSQYYPDQAKAYAWFAIVGFLAVAVTRFTGSHGTAVAVLSLVHAVAGLTIILLPLVVTRGGRAPSAFNWISVGGVLICVGGIALAFLKSGRPILSAELIFTILTPLLFLMTASYAAGLMAVLKEPTGKAVES